MTATARRFAIRWSRSAWVLTIAATAITPIGIVALVGAAMQTSADAAVVGVLLALEASVLVVILGVVVVLAPLGYSVSEDSVAIRRLFGSGGFLGFFGYFGYFSIAKLSPFLAYAEDTSGLILITQYEFSVHSAAPCSNGFLRPTGLPRIS